MSYYKLTPKQRLFIKHYMTNGFNATQAAITAGYPEVSARQIGSENLAKHDIKEEIERQMKKEQEKIGATREYILHSLKKIADKGVENVETDNEKVTVAHTLAAITELGKMEGFYKQTKSEVTVNLKEVEELKDEYKREF